MLGHSFANLTATAVIFAPLLFLLVVPAVDMFDGFLGWRRKRTERKLSANEIVRLKELLASL